MSEPTEFQKWWQPQAEDIAKIERGEHETTARLAWNAALEAAAKVAEDCSEFCAKDIRELKEET